MTTTTGKSGGRATRVWVDGASLVGRVTGIQRVARNLVQTLRRDASDLDVRAFRFFDDPRTSSAAMTWRTAPAPRRLHHFAARTGIAAPLELVLRTRPSIFFFPDYTTLPVTSLSRSVVAIYDLSVFTVPEYADEGLGTYLRREIPRSVARADAVITISAFAAGEIEERFPRARGRIHVVSPAAGEMFCVPESERLTAFRRRSDLQRPYVLFVGTLEPRKNLVGVLDAWARLPPEARRTGSLVIAGGAGWRDEEIKQRLRALGSDARTLGYVDDDELPLLYAGARALVFPSFYEGFGLPPLEAMACGTPVITSNVTSLPEVVGEAALLVDPYDVDALAGAMRTILEDDDLYARLRLCGLARARTFDWRESSRRLADIFRALA